MSIKGGHQLSAIVFVLAVCLISPACRTCQETGTDARKVSTASEDVHDVIRKLQEIMIPVMTFFPPATIIDAVDFFNQVCRDDDKPGTFLAQRGVNFTVRLPQVSLAGGDPQAADPFAVGAVTNGVVPKIPAISVRNISLFDAIKLVCDVTDMTLRIRGDGRVLLDPKGWGLDEDRIIRSYDIPPRLEQILSNRYAGQVTDAEKDKVWRAYFQELGVMGPDFAEVKYLPAIGKLRVTNTVANLAVVDDVFDGFASRLIEVEMQINAFRIRDIERLRLAGGVSVETLTALRLKGKSKPVASAKVLTKSGQEAVVKAVREVLYPTELYTGVSEAGSNVTSRSASKVLMPGNFERRETGMTLQVVPEVTQGGTLINLMLNPTWVTLEGWESYPADMAAGWTHKTLSLKQPVFGVTSFQTQASVEDGGTVLLGSCSTPDGEWVQVGFLTARLQEVQQEISGGKSAKTSRGRCAVKAKPSRDERSAAVVKKMRDMVIPEMTFRPPATIVDAVRFFSEASVKYDRAGVPEAQRGVSFVLKLPATFWGQTGNCTNADPFAAPALATNAVAHVISALSARLINLYDAVKLVCDVSGMKFRIKDGIVWIEPTVEPENELITRTYPVQTTMCERMRTSDCSRVDDDSKQDWRIFFVQQGVNWPEGSSVSYLASSGLLRVTNTPENLEVFEQVLKQLAVLPVMIEVEVQIYAFRPEDFEQLRLSGEVSADALLALRQKGKSRPVASATVLTKSGQEAVMKSVREMLYPTECGIDGVPGALAPCHFEMREAGMILQVVPEIAAVEHAQINLLLNPQWVTLDRWETYPARLAAGWAHKTLSFRQPVFGVTSFQTQVTVEDGGTVLLGSSSTPDGNWVQVGFLTVKRVDVTSERR